MTEHKRKVFELDAKAILFYRKNPCIACEQLLGIRLIDAQKYILQNVWNASVSVLCCCRDFGKSFLGTVIMELKAILYENQAIYIISNKGDQGKETFSKMESQILRIGKASASIKSLTDIPLQETVKSPTNKTGFSHAASGYHVEFYNGSEIFTLNGIPDNFRGKRASLIFLDEAAFSTNELIAVAEAFAVQDADFATSVDDSFNLATETRKCPTQIIYASSQSEMDKTFYRHYKNYAKEMFAGNLKYFVCDMICDTVITTYMNGVEYAPLITKDKVDAAIKANREKGLREYYNKPTMDGGENQIVKWGIVRRNETFILPEVSYHKGGWYAIAFDPARTKDNSVLTIMKICKSEEVGYYGEIVNCINMVDLSTKKKFKLDSNRQLDMIKETILNYNGKAADYENIAELSIDAGAGGGGISAYSDPLLKEWQDTFGITHKGFLDENYELYNGYGEIYPNTSDKITLLNPRKYKKEMTEQFVEMMSSDLIKFPREYDRRGFVSLSRPIPNSNEDEIYERELSWEEECALVNIDELKTEITSIFRYKNQDNTTITYALPKDKEMNGMHDDRFYSTIMLAHFLYNLRHANYKERNTSDYEYQTLVN